VDEFLNRKKLKFKLFLTWFEMAEYFDVEVFDVKALVLVFGDMFEGFWRGKSCHGFENSS